MISLTDSCIKHSTLRRSYGSGCGGARGGRTVCQGRFQCSIKRSYLDFSRDLFVWWSEMSNIGQHLS